LTSNPVSGSIPARQNIKQIAFILAVLGAVFFERPHRHGGTPGWRRAALFAKHRLRLAGRSIHRTCTAVRTPRDG